MAVKGLELWFDVEIEWITTINIVYALSPELWFDVEIEWITTRGAIRIILRQLWFDVEIEWITTVFLLLGELV